MVSQDSVISVDLTAISKLPVQRNMDGQLSMLECAKSSRFGRKQNGISMDTEQMMDITNQTNRVNMIREHQVRITNKWIHPEIKERRIS